MLDIEIGQDFELDGFWWLPDAPADRMPGKLTSREGEGIVLHLRGDFRRDSVEIEIILGKTYDGLNCTLINNYFIGPAIGSMDVDAPHFFESTFLVLGKIFDTNSAIIATSLSVSFTFLDEWLGCSPLTAGYPINTLSGEIEPDLRIFFNRPEQISLSIPAIDAKLLTEFTLVTDYGKYKPATQSFSSYITILPGKPQHYRWFLEKIFYIERFLTLLGGKPVRAKRIRCALNSNDFFSKWDFLVGRAAKRDAHIVHPSVLLIRKKDIAQNLEETVNAWFEVYERLDTVIDLFLGVSYNPKQYTTSNFLNLTQALEAYHRHLDQDKYLPIPDYEAVYNAMVPCIPKHTPTELKESLRSKLKYGNEFSLRSRLRRLFRSLNEDQQQLVTPNFKEFIGRVVDTRNYYTHYDKSLGADAAQGLELIEMNKQLSALILLILYKELQINEDAIKAAISKILKPPFFYDPMSDD